MLDKYDFSGKFQTKAASLICRDPTFVQEFEDVINPKYFEDTDVGTIVKICIDLYKEFKQIPTKETLVEKIRDFCNRFNISDDVKKDILLKIDSVYNADLSDALLVRDEITQFGQHQALKTGVLDIVDIIDSRKDYNKTREVLEKALLVGSNTQDLGMDFTKSIADVETIIKKQQSNVEHRVRSFLPLLDHYTLGGPARGEMWCVMALPGIGKSQFLVNMAVASMMYGIPVVYITIGDLTEEDIFIRMLSRLTFTDQKDILALDDVFLRKAKKISKFVDRYLRIKYYPSGSATPQTIRALLTKLVSVDKVKPGLLIVDYPDEFKPYADDLYSNSGRQYSELSHILSDFNCCGWVASQISRSDLKAKNNPLTDKHFLIRMTNIADSWKKSMKLDGLVSLNQTVEEYQQGRSRLWIEKVRRGEKFKLIHMDIDYKMSYMKQTTREEEEDE